MDQTDSQNNHADPEMLNSSLNEKLPIHSIPDFDSPEVQKHLSPSALKMFLNIVELWQIGSHDAQLLLGSRDEQILHLDPENAHLDRDILMRISYLIGIFKALNLVHGQKLADQWISLPNRNAIFGGQSPLQFMISGGLPAMQRVRRLLDARHTAD